MPQGETVEFWFDFSSPYAYFAHFHIEELAARHKRAVLWRPFLLGAAFQATGMQSLSKTPIRGDYALLDWERMARRESIPFQLPETHPAISVNPARAFYWLEESHPDAAIPFAKAVFRRCFADGRDISKAEAVIELGASCGVASETLQAALADQAVKDRFRARTDEAIARGVFGSPFFFIDGEPFWGSDRLAMMDDWMTRGGW